MALDFTVVFSVRQRFGDSKLDDIGQETEAPFVGAEKEYPFSCPNVDSSQQAILLFQCQGANLQEGLEINGQLIFGEIPASVTPFIPPPGTSIPSIFLAQWNGNVMLVHPGVLRANNVLTIRARQIRDTGNIDNFIVDNVVVLFKTARTGPTTGGGVLTQ